MSRFAAGAATPRRVRRGSIITPVREEPKSGQLEMDVGAPDNATLPLVMSSGTTTVIDPNLSFDGGSKMLVVPGVDTDQVVAPRTLTLEADSVVVKGALSLADGRHKLEIPYPDNPNSVLHYDGYEIKWVPVDEFAVG